MDEKIIKVHSFESLAALDGPGLRLAVFLQGCALRCAYCHNPDTWHSDTHTAFTKAQLVEKIMRYKPYFGENGGVTFSGGEPFLQAKALLKVTEQLKQKGVHIAFDTSGNVINQDVLNILTQKPMLLLDIKMPDEQRYVKYIKGSLNKTLDTLKLAQQYGCEVWIRYVVVAKINDSEQDIKTLLELIKGYACVKKIELLPYHTLGESKYEKLGIKYTLSQANTPTAQKMQELNDIILNS